MKRKGIPKEVLEELNINNKEEVKRDFEITAIVEKHQVKLPIPSKLRSEIEFKKSQKLKLRYNPKTRTLTYQL